MITYASTYSVSSIFEKRMLRHSYPTVDIHDDTPTVRTVTRLRVYHAGNSMLETVKLGSHDLIRNTWNKEISRTTQLLEYQDTKKIARQLLEEIENSEAVLDENLSNYTSSVYYLPRYLLEAGI